MTDTGISRDISPVKLKARLKSMYFYMSRAEALDLALSAVVDDYDAGVLSGEYFEGSGLVVVGESNSGKTREINQALRRMTDSGPALECGREKQILQITLDGETTWKALGLHVVERLGYAMTARRTEHEIWAQARRQLERTGTWLVHIDECQHMFETLGERDTRKVINSIKTFMKNRDWPVVVVLSGIPQLLDKVNVDPQLRNLMTPYWMQPVDPLMDEDIDEIDTAFYQFAESLGINIDEVRSEEVFQRMCYGFGNMYGRIFKFMIDVFSTLPRDQAAITVDFLADRYSVLTGCIPGHNVFLREDYRACDVDRLLAGME